MDGDKPPLISPTDLHDVLGSGAASVVIDIRCDQPAKGEPMLAGPAWRAPQSVDQWRADLPGGRSVVALHLASALT
jgi:hypothetical protein